MLDSDMEKYLALSAWFRKCGDDFWDDVYEKGIYTVRDRAVLIWLRELGKGATKLAKEVILSEECKDVCPLFTSDKYKITMRG